MGKPPCCDKSNVKRGLWTAEEDAKILAYVSNHGVGNWTLVPKKAGLNRCGKSCRLRWTNYLRPDLRHDSFSPQEEDLIIKLHQAIGSRWSLIAKQLAGRTDNDVKNYWNTKLRKKLSKMGIDPITHKPFSQILYDYGTISNFPNPNTSKPNSKPQPRTQPQPQLQTQTHQPCPLPWSFPGNTHFFNEVTATSSPSSSSSSSSSSCSSSGLIPQSLFLSDCYQKQRSNSSSSCCYSDHQQHNGLIESFSQSSNGGGIGIGIGFGQGGEACSSSSFNSFVDALFEQDFEINASFPELLDDESFDF